MNSFIITVDLDWACEPAIEETLDFLKNKNIATTVFATHRSPTLEASMNELEVGLHPYFAPDSSHGSTIDEVVKHVMNIPHNLPAFRCHRFAICNTSRQAMVEAGMLISSNVCTDLEIVSPFKDRFGTLEVPIFLEDGGYLWRNHPMKINQALMKTGMKVITIHPMHFSLNTPNFTYMYDIKKSLNRKEWKGMTQERLHNLRWKGRGIRDLLVDLLKTTHQTFFLGELLASR